MSAVVAMTHFGAPQQHAMKGAVGATSAATGSNRRQIMSGMAERLISPISSAELDRRWAAVRAAMTARGIDVLAMQSSNEFSGGYVKWFTDMPSGNGTMTTYVSVANSFATART
jgi:hypothetical protein